MGRYNSAYHADPQTRLTGLRNQALMGRPSEKVMHDVLANDVQFADFCDFSKRLYNNIKMTWYISGHLTEQRAISLFSIVRSNVKHEGITG